MSESESTDTGADTAKILRENAKLKAELEASKEHINQVLKQQQEFEASQKAELKTKFSDGMWNNIKDLPLARIQAIAKEQTPPPTGQRYPPQHQHMGGANDGAFIPYYDLATGEKVQGSRRVKEKHPRDLAI